MKAWGTSQGDNSRRIVNYAQAPKEEMHVFSALPSSPGCEPAFIYDSVSFPQRETDHTENFLAE